MIDAFHFEPPPGPFGALRGAFARRMYLRNLRAAYPRLRMILAEPEVAPAVV